MDQAIRKHFDNIQGNDGDSVNGSYKEIIDLTNQPVDWAYEVWDELLALTITGDNHQRTIAVQILSNLAKSDPGQRMLKDIDKLVAVTRDEKFVTARHSLQCLWKVGIAGDALYKKVIERLSKRFHDCLTEKNCTLIRYDILEVFRKIYDKIPDQKLLNKVVELIESEENIKYKKKYSGILKEMPGEPKSK